MKRRRSPNCQVLAAPGYPVFMGGLLLFLLALTIAPMSHADIVINEVLADPNSDWDGDGIVNFRGDEWVELLNNGSETVNLNVYWLRDESAYDPDVRLWGFLEPGEVAVFYGSEVVAWQEVNEMAGTGFALNNSGDQVFLLHESQGQSWEEFVVVDNVIIENHVADNDRSGGLSQDGSAWVLYDYWMPYNGSSLPGGTSCIPSPGELNVCPHAVANVHESLDGVKALYR